MLKIKSRTKLWIPVLTTVFLLVIAINAYATSVTAEIEDNEPLDIGPSAVMSGTVYRVKILNAGAEANYLTTYLRYGGNTYNDPSRMYLGPSSTITDIGDSKTINPVIENYWEGHNPSTHRAYQ